MKAYGISTGGEEIDAVILASSEKDAMRKLKKYAKKMDRDVDELLTSNGELFEMGLVR